MNKEMFEKLDLAIIWQETAQKLSKYYYKKSGITLVDIMEVLPAVIDFFEEKLFEEVVL